VKYRIFALGLLFGCGAFVSNADPLPAKGPNGGQIAESGEHHVELVVKAQTLTVHLLDHKSKPTNEAGVVGAAKVTAGGASETVALESKANGVFTGAGKFPATGALKVEVTLTPPNEPAVSATFDVAR
jgi:hypothetical protein